MNPIPSPEAMERLRVKTLGEMKDLEHLINYAKLNGLDSSHHEEDLICRQQILLWTEGK